LADVGSDTDRQVTDYLGDVEGLLRELPVGQIITLVERLAEGYRHDQQIFAFGNGGSAATATHFMEDLAKSIDYGPGRRRFRAISLCANVPLITAWANDTAYENIFAEQLRNLVRAGDVVIGISGSGNSPNVVNAIRLANELGAHTVGLSGFDGGALRSVAREAIVVPCHNMQQVEDVHLVICHLTFCLLRDRDPEGA
jgi:D-sedoheptulose 7-phosphate isomerase